MIDSLADNGWLAEIGAMDGTRPGLAALGEADALTATLFSNDPEAVRTAIGVETDPTLVADASEIAGRVLAHLRG